VPASSVAPDEFSGFACMRRQTKDGT
jgi:hypothetical protein